ncbi:extensin family protein [Histidinibacterium lentulum]|nr:extensin family protein [Histidinibacterium lentulum]
MAVLAVATGPLRADAPESSLRPQARGGETAAAPAAPVTPAARPVAAAPEAAAAPDTVSGPEASATPEADAWFDVDVTALAPDSSVRPQARQSAQLETVPPPAPEIAGAAVARFGPAEDAEPDWFDVNVSALAPSRSLRPPHRSPEITARAERAQEQLRRGAVCGDLAIQGETIGQVSGPGRCGIENAVRVRSVSGVRLSTPAMINCPTAVALKNWVERGLKPAVGGAGGGPVQMHVMASYSCRGRNNNPNARLSEHSFGNAIDIGAVRLADGREISVLRDWNRAEGRVLRAMHSSACGIFGTVLGPASNAAHRDHFHFDIARYRSNAYCR